MTYISQRNTTKIIAGLFIAVLVVAGIIAGASHTVATVTFNTHSSDCATMVVTNQTTGQATDSRCLTSTVNVQPGDRISVRLSYHNTGDEHAQNVRLKIGKRDGSAEKSHVIHGSVHSGTLQTQHAGGLVTINASEPVELRYDGGIQWYPDNQDRAQDLLYGQTGEEIFTHDGLRVGNIAQGSTDQGTVVLTYKIVDPETTDRTNTLVNVTSFGTSSVGRTSAVLRGHYSAQNTDNVFAYFEYGQTSAMNKTTPQVNHSDTRATTVSREVGGLSPKTTYYYRLCARAKGVSTTCGAQLKFTTRSATVVTQAQNTATRTPTKDIATNTLETKPKTLSTEENTIVHSTTEIIEVPVIQLSIDNERHNISPDQFVTYDVSYTNMSDELLRDTIIRVELPQDVVVVEATSGTYSAIDHAVTLDIGLFAPNEHGSFMVSTQTGEFLMEDSEVVATLIASFEMQSGARETINAYDADTVAFAPAKNSRLTATASDGGINIFPKTLIGWLMIILVIVLLIIVAREITQQAEDHKNPKQPLVIFANPEPQIVPAKEPIVDDSWVNNPEFHNQDNYVGHFGETPPVQQTSHTENA